MGTVAPQAVPENTYGQRQKLLFYLERIEAFRQDRPPNEIRLLDLGCGTGAAVSIPVASGGYQLVGIDVHEPSIDYARQNNPYENVSFHLADLSDLEVADGFDVVLLSDILEHLDDPGKVLGKARSLLRPGGIVLGSIPNGFGPFEIESLLFRSELVRRVWMDLILGLPKTIHRLVKRIRQQRTGPGPPYNFESGHLQFFTMRRFSNMMRRCGFVDPEMRQGGILCGPFSDLFLNAVPGAIQMNLKLGRLVPQWLCSVWYFETRPRRSSTCP